MMQLFMASVLAGVALPEICMRSFRRPWVKSQLLDIKAGLTDFRAATTDDTRQALLLRCGAKTMMCGLAALLLIAFLSALVLAAPLLLMWDRLQITIYLTIVSVVATATWLVRRYRPGKGHDGQPPATH